MAGAVVASGFLLSQELTGGVSSPLEGAHARSSAGACGRLRREERQADGTGRCRLGITGLPPGRHRVALATSLRVAGGVAFNLPLGPSRGARRGQGQGSRLPCPPEAIAGAGP